MPPSTQFVFSFVCLLLMVNSVFGLPAAIHRQRRQSFDFSSNNNVDGASSTTSSVNGGNEGKTFNFGNASTRWDAADRAPIAAADDVYPDIYEDSGFTNENNDSDSAPESDYGGGDSDYPPMYPGDFYYDDNGGNSDVQPNNCQQDCLLLCLATGTCDMSHCTNFLCNTDPGNDTDSCQDLCDFQCATIGVCDKPQCADYCEDYEYIDDPLPSNSTPRTDVPKKSTTTLRPRTERRCINPLMICIHGFCKNDTECQCDEGWIGVTCIYPCTLKCVYGNCKIKPSVSMSRKSVDEITEEDMFCNCEHGYYGNNCQAKIPDKVALAEEKGRKLAIILGTCLIVAILTSVILPVILWKKRVIFVMRVVYFFKMWEDNDGKTYDAYISAGTTSRSLKFVRNVLAPKLEQQGFKLFIPSRDQLCGAVMSEDIITAIKQSRRTIMVVTPEYLHNDWSGFEVLNAQVEMIKLQQRIIPVILEDVSEEVARMRKSLKHILDSVKCLKVPGYKSTFTELQLLSCSKAKKKISKFWRRLELTMPKKRELLSSCESNRYTQKYLPEQQNMLDDTNSKSVPDSHISTNRDETCDSIKENLPDFYTKSYDTMLDSKINPLSVYQISSNDQEIDISKYEQCFNFKTVL